MAIKKMHIKKLYLTYREHWLERAMKMHNYFYLTAVNDLQQVLYIKKSHSF